MRTEKKKSIEISLDDLERKIKEASKKDRWLSEMMQNPHVYDTCVFCGDVLHNPNNFPEGYPEDKKLCCLCLKFLKAIIYDDKYSISYFGKYKDKLIEMFTIQKGDNNEEMSNV